MDWNRAWWHMPVILILERVGGSWVQGQHGLQSEFEASLGYIGRSCIRGKNVDGMNFPVSLLLMGSWLVCGRASLSRPGQGSPCEREQCFFPHVVALLSAECGQRDRAHLLAAFCGSFEVGQYWAMVTFVKILKELGIYFIYTNNLLKKPSLLLLGYLSPATPK
jgi:hypothetical protein